LFKTKYQNQSVNWNQEIENSMPVIRLPDGSQRSFDAPVSVADVAMNIGAGLAKAALAGKVNDKIVDTSFIIESDSDLAIITDKNPEGLEIIRHSCASDDWPSH
jgi:threonyl-tRNA synthetase